MLAMPRIFVSDCIQNDTTSDCLGARVRHDPAAHDGGPVGDDGEEEEARCETH